MLTAIIILLVLNLGLSFLALSASGRVLQQLWDDAGASVEAHNVLINKFRELSETNNSALDCLVSQDAAMDIIRSDYQNKAA